MSANRDDIPQGRPLPALKSTCLYLGRDGDPGTTFLLPHPDHRCYATAPAGPIEAADQERHCFADCGSCARYIPPLLAGRRAAPRVLEGAAAALSPAAPGGKAALDGRSAAADPAAGRRTGAAERRAWPRLSFEAWALALVGVALLAALVGGRLLRGEPAQPEAAAPAATATPSPADPTRSANATAAPPSPSAGPTLRPAAGDGGEGSGAGASGPAGPPTAPPGGLVAALSPVERGVGSFPAGSRLPVFGDRNLRVGRYGGEEYLGGILFPLGKLPKGSRVAYVALELAGLSDSQLGAGGEWTVELLDPAAATDWSNLTYQTLDQAPATQLKTAWRLPDDQLAPRRVNVLEFSPEALDVFIQRLPEGKVAFRLRGPAGGGAEDRLFIWDTGYGEGFGLRPVLRVAFVPPPATATPARGEGGAPKPTPLPLIVWVSDPTPAPAAPTATPFPMGTYGLLKGMVLFYSDRFKPREGLDNSGKPLPGLGNPDQQLMVYDPASGRTGQVTQDWTYRLAVIMNTRAADARVGMRQEPCEGGKCQVITITDEAGGTRPLSLNGFTHYDPTISPDGQWVVFVSNGYGNDELVRIPRGGGDELRLTDNSWEWDKHPSFSPDGSQIVFFSNRDGRSQIYVMKADGTETRKLMESPYNDTDPVWVR